MNYTIIENDPATVALLTETTQRLYPDWHLAFATGSVAEAVEWLSANHEDVHLIMADTELPDGSGLEIFDAVDILFPVIFLSATDDDVQCCLRQNCMGYLRKPIDVEAVEEVLAKYSRIERYLASHYIDYLHVSWSKNGAQHDYMTRVLTGVGDQYCYVNIADVAGFYTEDKYVLVLTKDGHKHITFIKSLGELEEWLDPNIFFRLSRDVIASISAIAKVSKYFKGRLHVDLKAANEKRTLTVSAERRPEFLAWLGR